MRPAAESSGSAREVREDFLRLVCADPELLRAEFDEIVGDQWDQPPDHPGGRTAMEAAPLGRPDLPADRAHVTRGAGSRHSGIEIWARPRSPPVHSGQDQSHSEMMEGR